MDDRRIDNRACFTVSAPVSLLLLLGEEANVVAFANHDHGNGGLDLELVAGLCTSTVSQVKK